MNGFMIIFDPVDVRKRTVKQKLLHQPDFEHTIEMYNYRYNKIMDKCVISFEMYGDRETIKEKLESHTEELDSVLIMSR